MPEPSHARCIGLATVALISATLTGCYGGIRTDANGLRTFSSPSNVMCTADRPIAVVQGVLRTDPAQSDPVWLVDTNGKRLSVVWPAGFTIRFDPPPAVLLNERGEVVAADGAWVTLGHTRPSDAAGTFDDPYFASGLTLGGCYPR